MKPLKYSALMPKIALENLKLIEVDDLLSLIGKDLEAIRCFLQESAYQDEISSISTDELGTLSLEKALLQNYVKTCKALIKSSSSEIKNLLLAVLRKVEVSNVKALLRAVKAKIDIDEAIKHIIPVGTLDEDRCRAILAGSKGIGDVINSLRTLEYVATLKMVTGELTMSVDLLPLEVALDKAVFQGIIEAAEKLKGLDKTIAKSVLGIEVDFVNVKIILRCKAKGVNPDHIKDYLMPTVFIDEDVIEEAIQATDVKPARDRLLKAIENIDNTFYKNVFNQVLNGSDLQFSLLERMLDSASLKMSLHMLKRYTRYYNIGFILAYLSLKWFEIKNVRCIIQGSKRKTPISQVKQLLVIPSK